MEPPKTRPKRKLDTEDSGDASRFAPSPRAAHPITNRNSITGSASQMQLASKFSAGRATMGNNSFGNSVGPGRRTFSNQIDRPQSRTQRTPSSAYRPTSSQEVYPRPSKGSQGTRNQGRILFSSTPSQVNESPTEPEDIGCYDPHIYRDAHWESPCAKGRLRDGSMTSILKTLTMNGKTTSVDMNASLTPSQIPLCAPTHSARAKIPSPSKSPKKALSLGRFLTRDSNTPVAWNTEDRFERMENGFSELKEIIGGATSDGASLKDIIAIYKTKGR